MAAPLLFLDLIKDDRLLTASSDESFTALCHLADLCSLSKANGQLFERLLAIALKLLRAKRRDPFQWLLWRLCLHPQSTAASLHSDLMIDWVGKICDPSLLADMLVNHDLDPKSLPIVALLVELSIKLGQPQTVHNLVEAILEIKEAYSSVDFAAVQAQRQSDRQLIEAFNRKPKQTAARLMLQVEGDEDLPRWLLQTPGLNKAAIGEVLADADNRVLLKAFVKVTKIDKETSFAEGLRRFVVTHRMPGESQKIERILEAWSAEGQSEFDSDTAFKLAYSIIMLNTDLHSPQVRAKMDSQSWLKNNRGIGPNHSDLPDAFMLSVYREIQRKPIALSETFTILPYEIFLRPWQEAQTAGDKSISALGLQAVGRKWSLVQPMKWELADRVLDYCYSVSLNDFASELIRNLGAKASASWLLALMGRQANALQEGWFPLLEALGRHSLGDADDFTGAWEASTWLCILAALPRLPSQQASQVALIQRIQEAMDHLGSAQLERLVSAAHDHQGRRLFALLAPFASISGLRSGGWALCGRLCREQMPLLCSLLIEKGDEGLLTDFLDCLGRFGQQGAELWMAEEAIAVLRQFGQLQLENHLKSGPEGRPVDQNAFYLSWYRILHALGRIATEQSAMSTSMLAASCLFDLLTQQAPCYQPEYWRKVYRSLLMSLVDDLRAQGGSEAEVNIQEAMRRIVKLYDENWTRAGLFSPLIELLGDLILSREAIGGEETSRVMLWLCLELIQKIEQVEWNVVVHLFERVLSATLPTELFSTEDSLDSRTQSQTNLPVVETRSPDITPLAAISMPHLDRQRKFSDWSRLLTIHLMALVHLRDLELTAHLPAGPDGDALTMVLVKQLEASLAYARQFNGDQGLRQRLVEEGFQQSSAMSASSDRLILGKQEREACTLMLTLLKARPGLSETWLTACMDCLRLYGEGLQREGTPNRWLRTWATPSLLSLQQLSQQYQEHGEDAEWIGGKERALFQLLLIIHRLDHGPVGQAVQPLLQSIADHRLK